MRCTMFAVASSNWPLATIAFSRPSSKAGFRYRLTETRQADVIHHSMWSASCASSSASSSSLPCSSGCADQHANPSADRASRRSPGATPQLVLSASTIDSSPLTPKLTDRSDAVSFAATAAMSGTIQDRILGPDIAANLTVGALPPVVASVVNTPLIQRLLLTWMAYGLWPVHLSPTVRAVSVASRCS
jgi:hypothetical protein